MNYNKKSLIELTKWYECLSVAFIKKDRKVPKEYNIILDLIEDLQEKQIK